MTGVSVGICDCGGQLRIPDGTYSLKQRVARALVQGRNETVAALQAMIEIANDETIAEADKPRAFRKRAAAMGWEVGKTLVPTSLSDWAALLAIAIFLVNYFNSQHEAEVWKQWTEVEWERIVQECDTDSHPEDIELPATSGAQVRLDEPANPKPEERQHE